MKIGSQEWFAMRGHKITVIEAESKGEFQDYLDDLRDLLLLEKCWDNIEEFNRKSRIAFGLDSSTNK